MRFIVKNLMLFEAFGISVHPQSGTSDRGFRKLPGDGHFEVLKNFSSPAGDHGFYVPPPPPSRSALDVGGQAKSIMWGGELNPF